MTATLALAIVVVAAVSAVWSTVTGVRDRPRGRRLRMTMWALEAALLAQAVGALVAMARGHRPAHVVVFLSYALTSVVLLPLLAGWLSSDEHPWTSRLWPGVLSAVACVSVAVVVVRMGQTWQPRRA